MIVKLVKHILKLIKRVLLFFFGFVVIYLLTALVCSNISTNPNNAKTGELYEIYASSNGVHSDVIIPIELLKDSFNGNGIDYKTNPKYLAFGWGDKGFYLNTPTWGDLTFSTAVNAVFLKSPTAMHVTEYANIGSDWKKVKIDKSQLMALIYFVQNSFELNSYNEFIKITSYSYGSNDIFYEAKGSYSCIRTCNTWTNEAMKKANIKTAIWTPFDWGVLKHL